MTNNPNQLDTPWQDLSKAAALPHIHNTLLQLYNDIDNAVATHNPTCHLSGRCCDFDNFNGGHLLYVTALEIAWAIRQLNPQNLPKPQSIDLKAPCPFQQNKLCSIHTIRPLGCRIFFCEHTHEQWQNQLYEQFQNKLRTLHDQHHIDYHYIEWRTGLRQAISSIQNT